MTFPNIDDAVANNHHANAVHFYLLGKQAWDAGVSCLTACPYKGWQAECWKAGMWARRSELLADPMTAVRGV